jgi:hypothetical protein
MKFIVLQTNCNLYDIKIIKESDKNKVFGSREDIDQWICDNDLDSNNYTIISFEEFPNDLKNILSEYNCK